CRGPGLSALRWSFVFRRAPAARWSDGTCKDSRGRMKEQFRSSQDAENAERTRVVPEPPSIVFGSALFSFGLQLPEVVVETFEAFLPEAAVVLQPLGCILERCRLEAARAPLCLAAARDQPGSFQHFQVFGNGRHAHLERLRQFGHRTLAQRQTCKDRSPGGIGERGKRAAQGVWRHLTTDLSLDN